MEVFAQSRRMKILLLIQEISIRRGARKPSEVFVVRNGPDLDKFQPVDPNKELISKGKIVVGYLGNMNICK